MLYMQIPVLPETYKAGAPPRRLTAPTSTPTCVTQVRRTNAAICVIEFTPPITKVKLTF